MNTTSRTRNPIAGPIPAAQDLSFEAIIGYLRQLNNSQFFGAISLRYEKGRIVHLYREESIKPETILTHPSAVRDEPRSNNESNNRS